MLSIKYEDLEKGVRDLVEEVSMYSWNASKYGELLEESLELVKKPALNSRYLNPGVIELDIHTQVIIIGDIHGDFYSLLSLLNTTWDYLENKNGLLIFLGDYVDRGYAQLETFSAVLLLKAKYPENVVLLRGNHEPPKWLTPYPHDYPYQLETRFKARSRKLYELSLALFDALPLVVLAKEKFIALHGGPPTSVLNYSSFEEVFEVGREKPSDKLLEDILWSDPIEMDITYRPSPRGAGVLFGTKITDKTLEMTKVRYIVRAHEAVNGTRKSHGGRVITVFSSPLVYGFKCAGLVKSTKTNTEYELIEKCVNVRL